MDNAIHARNENILPRILLHKKAAKRPDNPARPTTLAPTAIVPATFLLVTCGVGVVALAAFVVVVLEARVFEALTDLVLLMGETTAVDEVLALLFRRLVLRH
jgi:hypothetical protein